MSHTDKELLDNYTLGWNDCSNGIEAKTFPDKLMQRSYIYGWIDFIAGDDVSSVDDQTDEEILSHIKGLKKEF